MGRYSTSFIVTLAVALFFEIRSKKLYFTGFSLTSADLCGRAVRQFGREIESAFPLITLNSTHFDRQQTRRQYTYVLHVKYILQFTWLKLIKKNCLIKRSTLFSGLSEKYHKKTFKNSECFLMDISLYYTKRPLNFILIAHIIDNLKELIIYGLLEKRIWKTRKGPKNLYYYTYKYFGIHL